MKVYITFAASILIDVSATSFGAPPPTKKNTGGTMMRALQAQNLCEAEGTALGLCLGSAGVTDLYDINACAFCSVDAIVNTGFDDCSASDVDGFYAYIQSCGVDACHTSCRDELQVAAECMIKVTCPDAASNDVASGGGFANGFGSFSIISFASIIIYAVGIM